MADIPYCDIGIEVIPCDGRDMSTWTTGRICRTHGFLFGDTTLANRTMCPYGRIARLEQIVQQLQEMQPSERWKSF